MALDLDKIKEDASGILGKLKNITPGGQIANLIKQAEIIKVIKELLKRTSPGQAAEVVKLIIDRYQLDPDVAQRLVANEMTDANIPTDSSGGADEGYRPIGIESSAEDYYENPPGLGQMSEIRPGLGQIPEDEILGSRRDPGFAPINDYRPETRGDPGFAPLEGKGERVRDSAGKYIKEPFRFFDPPAEYIKEPFNLRGKNAEYEYAYNQGGRAGYNQGGRTGFQTGGVTESRVLPPEYVEALGKTYAADLTRQAGIPTITTATTQQPGETAQQFAQRQAQAQQFGITKAGMAEIAPQVAAQDHYQAAAYAQAVDPTKGLGGYQPYLQAAGTAAGAATGLTGTGAGTGAGSIASYMSPYQQQVIDATMADYDAQAAKSRLGLGAQAVSGGAFGSGRHGIAEAEFDALSNRGRASQLANLRQTGFQQAAQRRQQDLANQMGISNLQQGLGSAQQDFARGQIAGLGTLGATQQAQNQAVLDAQRQAAQMAVQDPQRRLNMLGSGVMGLMGGMGAGRTELGEAPAGAAQSSPLATALGVGLAGADIYSRLFRPTKS